MTEGQLLGFTKTEDEGAWALLLAMTADASRADRLLCVAWNLARYLNIDLVTAAARIADAEAGNLKNLRRIGFVIPADQADPVEYIERQVAGQADAYATTYYGRMDIAWESFAPARAEVAEDWRRFKATMRDIFRLR